jgi:hypothetical protein
LEYLLHDDRSPKAGGEIRVPATEAEQGFRASASINDAIRRTREEEA